MRCLIISWSLLGLLATPWVSAIVYQDSDLTSIVIDDSPDDGIEFVEDPEATTQSLPAEGVQTCTNDNGAKGTCIKFEKCFPYLANYESEDFESFQFYEIVNSTVTPCEGTDNLICCPDYGYYDLPTRKPQFAGQTTQAPETTTVSNSTAATNSTGAKNKNQECGANNFDDIRVVGGRPATKGEFPYAVALLNNGRQFCGGSLLSENWILTAAHCIANLKSFAKVSVNIGDHDVVQSTEVKHQSRAVKRGFYNKGFSWRNLANDVALLELQSAVTFSESVQPVCLSDTTPPYGMNAVLSGWGKTGKHQPPSSTLRTVKMRVIPHEECKKTYEKEPQAPPITAGMVCAGEVKPNLKDACNGDSGGPLVKIDSGKAYQIGVVSWGIGCGEKPGVYTRVDKYREWIDKNSKRT